VLEGDRICQSSLAVHGSPQTRIPQRETWRRDQATRRPRILGVSREVHREGTNAAMLKGKQIFPTNLWIRCVWLQTQLYYMHHPRLIRDIASCFAYTATPAIQSVLDTCNTEGQICVCEKTLDCFSRQSLWYHHRMPVPRGSKAGIFLKRSHSRWHLCTFGSM
jgi:hypothetical protein